MGVWLVYALLSAATAALVAIFGKIGLKDIDANSATAIRAVIMALFLLGVVAVQGKFSQLGDIVAQKKALAFIALSGAAGAASWLFYFLALKGGKVAQVGPIDKLSVVLAVALAYFFLGERISLVNALGVAMIAAGAILVAWKA
ncbi:EamA family transporter [Cohnella suwonensis]|uniref:EamA family transporter n=1 Tax=Cohnella suwonensis TaxID=696072 RepID=A0ABW0LRG2_9BACL